MALKTILISFQKQLILLLAIVVSVASCVVAGCSLEPTEDFELGQIVFAGSIDSGRGIFTIDLDGTGLEKILVPDRRNILNSTVRGIGVEPG